MIKPTELDIVIVNYNSGSAIKQCIATLGVSEAVKINITVVDNYSSDESLDDIKNVISSNSLVQGVFNQDNKGFAKACNQGAHLGSAPFIAFINPDCFITAAQLNQLITVLSNNLAASLIGCKVINQDRSLQAASRRRLPTFYRILVHLTKLDKVFGFKGINITDEGGCDDVITVEAVNGACFVITRDSFQSINGFDEKFPLHFEDLDLFARIQNQGDSLLYHSRVKVVHWQGHAKQQHSQIKKWKKMGLARYMKKHRPRWEYLISRLFLNLK